MTMVLHVTGTLKGGGAEMLLRELVPRLIKRGIDTEVLSVYDSGLTRSEREALGCAVHEGEKHGRLDVRFPQRLLRQIRSIKPRILHSHTWSGKYWGRTCGLAAGVPVIMHTEHSPDPRLKAWEIPAARLLSSRTDAVVTFSQRCGEMVRAREPVRDLRIIPNGIEVSKPPTARERQIARDRMALDQSDIAVGVVASLQPRKNHRLAIEALAQTPEAERSRVRLEFFGVGPLEDELRVLARKLNVEAHVRFRGFRSDVREFLPGLDVFLSVAFAEAAPISMLEAMAAGLPVIATPHIGTLDMVCDGETGAITGWDAASVAAALCRAVREESWRQRCGRGARMRLEREFDIEIVADQYAALYAPYFQALHHHGAAV